MVDEAAPMDDVGPGVPFAEAKALTGRSARIVATMGMPSLERNILGFCGIAPIDETLIGMVDAPDNAEREKWLSKVRKLGAGAR